MVTTGVETLYETEIKLLSPQDRETLNTPIQQGLDDERESRISGMIADMHPIFREVLERHAEEQGRPFDEMAREWAEERLRPDPRPALSPEGWEAAHQRIRRHFGAIDSGDPYSADNERIDADLTREYAGGLPERS